MGGRGNILGWDGKVNKAIIDHILLTLRSLAIVTIHIIYTERETVSKKKKEKEKHIKDLRYIYVSVHHFVAR
jgi:hypothetical protein